MMVVLCVNDNQICDRPRCGLSYEQLGVEYSTHSIELKPSKFLSLVLTHSLGELQVRFQGIGMRYIGRIESAVILVILVMFRGIYW